ncbi:bifunctional phosphopantothenoylcysteine decarboxylase/phosphopantothenate--cysteine ligase CoaBC [Spiroplasma turonicum]|uniref:Coenzyme A biosynthesis bifunctional protein CoaBC n=1 Tax=Spiroplasma turonicum TaxID=216946 RepID=A0A0K1P6Z2_9MOLU|nr:bifunctional phosphopantothenoylcysteine decarboxylase/phosphopantothenate--cysteine ligase CoaBC [Spiroplasma turonicum]AKU79652.1 pantothenate metabolism flavoprotein [Spiroplasma turonicum]ALX70672.1 phosphopantothenoylcysteine synthetase/decarboxylase [Spiroplasma turonicum]
MKRINLIITGGIAASKSRILYELLQEKYKVNVILTKNAKKFVDFKDIDTYSDIFDKDFYYDNHHYAEHIKLAFNSDLNVIYPATYNYIGKIASGISDDLATLLFAVCDFDCLVFPSMNTNMYLNDILEKNKKILTSLSKVYWYEPKYGKLASGDYGIGRAYEPLEVIDFVDNYFKTFNKLSNKNILINFGRTKSYIDKVRYITNASSGKMGLNLMNALKNKCNNLISVFGDTEYKPIINESNIHVNTNVEMLEEMKKHFNNSDIVICAGALTDFEVENYVDKKIEKRVDGNFEKLNLKESIDVLKELSKIKTNQILVGFSLANTFDKEKALIKLKEKRLDLLVINLIDALNSDYNEIKILTKNEELYEYEKMKKDKVVIKILEKINDII